MRTMIAAVVAGLVLASALTSVDARPAYKTAFQKKYPDVVEKQGKTKTGCGVCHPEKSKKVRNDYGKALGKVVSKNEKDADKISEALGKVEKEKSSKDGKTFGDLLKDGELPGDK